MCLVFLLPTTQYFITETHRFPTVVQLIHHHSQAADGLICPLLYPAARREHPSVSSLLRCHSSSAGSSSWARKIRWFFGFGVSHNHLGAALRAFRHLFSEL